MKDRGSLRHFDHEGRAAAGKIVGCADAGVNAVDGTDRDRFCRHERARPRQKRDERHGAHVGRLAAHVGARDDEAAAAVSEAAVARNVGLDRRLDDGVAALDDLDAGTGGKRRANPVVLDRVSGVIVELGERASGGHQSRHVAGERGDEAVIELLLKRGGALLRGECLILVVLELGRDEALGVLERLSAVVFDGDGRGLSLGDLDVEAVDAVVLDAKAREPRLFALALFKVEEELARVVAHLAQES